MDYSELFTHFLGIIERSIKTSDKPESTAQECANLANYFSTLGKSSGAKYHTIYKGDSDEYGKEPAVVLCHKGTLGEISPLDKQLHPAWRLTKSYDMSNGIITHRREPIRKNELLYDCNGNPVAIKSNGKILPIIKGDL